MEYKIIDKEAFAVIGSIREISVKDGNHLKEIPAFWQDCEQDGTLLKLGGLGEGKGMFGICMNFENEGRFHYMIGVESSADTAAMDGFVSRVIPASAWAVFTSIGPMPDAIQQVWRHIYQEWLPTGGYRHAGGPELEVYPSGDTTLDDYRCEVWIRVAKNE